MRNLSALLSAFILGVSVCFGQSPELTQEQLKAIRCGSNYLAAKPCKTMNEGLSNLPSISVAVEVDTKTDDVVSKDTIKNKLELLLRRNGVHVSETANDRLQLAVVSMWDPDKGLFFHHRTLLMF